ncbi:L-lysine 6-monooxygenase [Fictibacillus macauensis ZFHKF-1]|uniref:L-lysine N6-monooxygenase MbtG n=1 Tax=Fictibacillus macauensis ZFHKF-1 TaxID=1196324 RepID=I8AKK6_9BACL|nr:lysine N(6)-hydroxylase/L-ornithine N(5)-oxygenase family protein [Fictibacillus macauensis]EIT86377.1 L-lysine 6-monooxygenase [Fictibacillus macauensis ZFHKF-1]
MRTNVYDSIGIGIGPFNLGMAALAADTELNCLFFDKKPEFSWHEGMLIEGSSLQVPFLADLVTMIQPTSRYSFLSYLHEQNRLYHFYFFEKFHIPRVEYNHYCQWVASQLQNCHFSKEVIGLERSATNAHFVVTVQDLRTKEVTTYEAKHVVLGIGSVPSVPKALQPALDAHVFHSAHYVQKQQHCKEARSLTVIGSGQSAAEVFLDLARTLKDTQQLTWFTRSNGFFPMEYSKLGLEYFSPDYIDFFYRLPQKKKDELLQQQSLLYKGIDMETIAAIYDVLYEKSIGGKQPNIVLQAMTEIAAIEKQENSYIVRGAQRVSEEAVTHETDIVVLGTGYERQLPPFLSSLENDLCKDDRGRFLISRDYQIKTNFPENSQLFIQNGELHTHGVAAPDLGLGAYRNAVILNAIAQRTIYPIHDHYVFQQFHSLSKKKGVEAYATI